MKDEADTLLNTYSKLQVQVENAMWYELGYVELSTNGISSLTNYSKSLNDNITTGLVTVCNKSINELYPLLITFKTKALEYENTKTACLKHKKN